MATSHESGNVASSNNFPKIPPEQPPAWAQKTQELGLHDGLDRLEDFTLMLAFQSYGSQFEIVSITPPTDDRTHSPTCAATRSDSTVVNLHQARLKKTA